MRSRSLLLVVLLFVFAASSAIADVLNFNNVPDATVLNTYYTGVTFSCVSCGSGSGPDVYARGDGTNNVISVFSTGLPFFDARWGGIKAAFDTAQRYVSIDAKAVLPPEYMGTPTNHPWIQFYDSSDNILGSVYYPFAYGDAGYGTYQTLSLETGADNIAYVIFSSQHSSGPAVYGEFDNLTYRVGTPGTVPEPSTVLLLGGGAFALLLKKRSK
ncbi:MAG TPA: PEP-CTERM sorting domain-containing protein [Terriglobales bacterium]|nr:PEP-CTERM sorting domain-containing protein [Terriglobales bacterium]